MTELIQDTRGVVIAVIAARPEDHKQIPATPNVYLWNSHLLFRGNHCQGTETESGTNVTIPDQSVPSLLQ